MVGTKFGANMFRFVLGFIFIILAVGAIDGPTGHEGDAWLLLGSGCPIDSNWLQFRWIG